MKYRIKEIKKGSYIVYHVQYRSLLLWYTVKENSIFCLSKRPKTFYSIESAENYIGKLIKESKSSKITYTYINTEKK